jgi:hypothetical protein
MRTDSQRSGLAERGRVPLRRARCVRSRDEKPSSWPGHREVRLVAPLVRVPLSGAPLQFGLIESDFERVIAHRIAHRDPVFSEPPLSAEPLCLAMLGMCAPRSNRFVRLELYDGDPLAVR